jgi:hypothetical protein
MPGEHWVADVGRRRRLAASRTEAELWRRLSSGEEKEEVKRS